MHVELLPFLGISILLILIPGPDTAVVTKNALVGGRRGGVYAALGVSLGLTIWTVAAALGLAALLKASAVAFLVLKLVGAVYLIWIGIQLLRSRDVLRENPNPPARTGGGTSLRQGLLSDLGNPKIAVFFTSFLPQFIHGDGPAFASLLVLGAIFVVLTLIWLAAYALLVGTPRVSCGRRACGRRSTGSRASCSSRSGSASPSSGASRGLWRNGPRCWGASQRLSVCFANDP
jgi:threonine/homoserine/homoserine lactone efflux protein